MSFTALISRLSGQAAAPAGDAAAKAAHLPLHEGLVVSHGINPKNIVQADATTGLALASPSLGVHKTTNPNMDFGSFLLIGKPRVLDDPKSSTYMSDVYSRRKPEITEKLIRADIDDVGKKELRPTFLDDDGRVTVATPENLVAYMNRAEDRLTEGLFSKSTVDDPSTILAATADEVGGAGGIQEVRHLLEGDLATTKKKMAVDKKDWRNLTADLGGLEQLDNPRLMQEASGKLMVDIISHMKAKQLNATEALLDMRAKGLFPEKLLPLLNTEHLPRLADSLAYGGTNYAEVRPHRMLEVRQGGELDTAIVSRQDMLTDPDGQKAVAILKAQGVDVHVIDAPWATPQYQRAFYEKMADLKKKGYVFGVGGATVAAGLLAPAEDSMAAEPAQQEPPERSQEADKAQGATTVASAAQDAPQRPAGGFTGLVASMGGGFAARRAEAHAALGTSGRFAGFTGQIRQNVQQNRQNVQQETAAVSPGVQGVADRLGLKAEWLHSVVDKESSGRAGAVNPSTGAAGIIQFLPSTAKRLGTTVEAIGRMTAEEQLPLVERYLKPYANRIKSLEDVHLAVFWPAAIGKPDSTVLFKKGTEAYEKNSMLDKGNKGWVTRGDLLQRLKK